MLGLGVGVTKWGVATEAAELTATTIVSYDFNSDTGSGGPTVTTLPTGWQKADSGNWTMFGSTNDGDLGIYQAQRGWCFDTGTTATAATGPIGGHAGGVDSDSGASDTGTGHRYLVYESSNTAFNTTNIVAGAIRLPELDFSSYSNVTMTLWFHAFGPHFGSTGGCGIALTDNSTSSSSADEVASGLGFTSATAGGATITYTDLGGSSVSTARLGHNGQVQTSGHEDSEATANEWIKATVNISAAAGSSSVYVHFGFFATAGANNYQQDLGIDSIKIVGFS